MTTIASTDKTRAQLTRAGRSISWRTLWRLRRAARKNRTLTAEDRFIFGELAPGDVALDCGANVGDISALMAERGAEVHAFEPDPNAYSVLTARFAGTPNVTCHNVAVSNRAAKMNLYFREEHDIDPLGYSVGSSLIEEKSDVVLESHAEVEVVRLAEFVERFERVRLLKLDIEGAEGDVLEDLLAAGLLERIDLTLVETHEEWVPSLAPRLEAVRAELAERGLRNVFMNWD